MEKIIQNLINEEKLETALIVDVTEFSEDGKEAIYNYYRGTRNDSFVSFGFGDGWIEAGKFFSAYDFCHDEISPGLMVTDQHKATLAGRAICEYLDIDADALHTKFCSKRMLVNYWW